MLSKAVEMRRYSVNELEVFPSALVKVMWVRCFDIASHCVFKKGSFKSPSGALLSAHVRPPLQGVLTGQIFFTYLAEFDR